MATAKDVAEYILYLDSQQEETDITNLKLQKLMYYVQGFSLVIFGERLIDARMEAWTHGPVFPETYHEYKTNGSKVIEFEEHNSFSGLTEIQKSLIDEVYGIYGQYSGWTLREMTHQESPWIKNEKFALEISDDDLIEFFETRIN